MWQITLSTTGPFRGWIKRVTSPQVSLDRAVAYETARTVEHLAHQGLPIYPQTLETYNAFVKYLKED